MSHCKTGGNKTNVRIEECDFDLLDNEGFFNYISGMGIEFVFACETRVYPDYRFRGCTYYELRALTSCQLGWLEPFLSVFENNGLEVTEEPT